MLKQKMATVCLAEALVSNEAYHPFPKWKERDAWNALSAEVKAYYQGAAWALRDYRWQMPTATEYMRFSRDGNRAQYEEIYLKRRSALLTYLIAECIQGEKQYIDQIIDGIWAICEESTWVLPAHNNLLESQQLHTEIDALVDQRKPVYIDLFSAETSAYLAWAFYLLGEQLREVSPLVPQRIEDEIMERTIRPYADRADFHWMGFSSDQPVNNWNPWINSNVLAVTLILCGDPPLREHIVRKCAESSQRFLDGYAPDGGCDEGPLYFTVAGASMLDVLEMMHESTNGAVSLYDNKLIWNLARYIMHMHVADEYHVNFADAEIALRPPVLVAMRAAIAMGDQELMRYAKWALRSGFAMRPYEPDSGRAYRRFKDLFMYHPELYQDAVECESAQHYFDGIQVMTARSDANAHKGLFIGAKGGHNGESHNHNDVGNYIVFLDGQPMICDVGVETYERKTFSDRRYELWTKQSGFHNTVILNGYDQCAGAAYSASDVVYVDGANPILEMNMEQAYPKDACVKRYRRRIEMNRSSHHIAVKDIVSFTALKTPLKIPLMCAVRPEIHPGRIQLCAGVRILFIEYPAHLFQAGVEEIKISDARLLAAWKRLFLYRVLLTRKDCVMEDTYELNYSIGERDMPVSQQDEQRM